MKRWMAVLFVVLFPAGKSHASEPFVIKDMRVDGLQRIEAGTVFNYLPLAMGDTLDDTRATAALRALFKTGFFSDIRLERDGDALVVTVVERPSIAEIKITGNEAMKTDDLLEGLKKTGLAEGKVFDRSMLEQVRRELERQYFARGKYGVRISAETSDLDRNRVAVALKIDEGQVAKIRQISLLGNQAFDERTLLDRFQLSTAAFATLFSGNNQYSKQALAADLESLRSYYLDRGYIDFNIDSTQVSITPDKRDVYITANLSEGERFRVKEIKLAGVLIAGERELRDLITVQPGEVFSRRLTAESATRINDRLGREGYAFANVNPVPDVNRETREITLTFFVDPGKRVYVRRVNIAGNTRTSDEVLRREARQMEGGWISTEAVNRSRVRLQRLGYFEEVNVETPSVPGTQDQVDVNMGVKERSSFGSMMAGVGFSQAQGLLLNASINWDNFLGTGKRVTAAINNSQVNTVYSFSYTNPYYTLDGVSRGFRVFLRQTDAGAANAADYTSDVLGGSVSYGIPLSEYNTLRFSLGYERTTLHTNSRTPQSYLDFIADNTDEFDAYKVTLGWSHDTRNRAFFPTAGMLESLSSETTLPGSGLTFYKLSSRTTWYHELVKNLTFSLDGEVAYGAGYGDTSDFPFFENYYAGGVQSVRGYRSNSLGPREGRNTLGGAFKTVGTAELFFPPPFAEDTNTFRLSLFFDIGNVYSDIDTFDAGELRQGAGVGAVWLSPIGPLTFSFGQALNDKKGDETQMFQFSLGALF